MPELPEVETIVRELREAGLEGKKVVRAEIFWERSVALIDTQEFREKIAGQEFLKIYRRGKFIVFQLPSQMLLVHLRMTGQFAILTGSLLHSHERVRLYLDDGSVLSFQDQRKFGKWYLLPSSTDFLNKIGLEPLSAQFTYLAFEKILQRKNSKIKPFLLDQRYICGLGNIYVDEALWEARIHPTRGLNTLTLIEKKALFQAIPKVLQKGVENSGTSLGLHKANYLSVSGRRGGNQHQLNVFRREGLACPRCGSAICKIVVAQRGTHLCPCCQQCAEKGAT